MHIDCKITLPFFSRRLFTNASPGGEIALYKVMDDPAEFEKEMAKLVNAARTALNEVEKPLDIFDLILTAPTAIHEGSSTIFIAV